MLGLPMKPPGSYRLMGRARRTGRSDFGPHAMMATRSDRIVDSLRVQILDDEGNRSLRIRQIFEEPTEVYRIEIEHPEYRCQRTTLLDRDALEDLLATEDVRDRFVACANGRRASSERRAGEGQRAVPGAGLEPARPEARRF